MRITVKAKPGARGEKVEKLEDGSFVVAVKEKPEKGKANFAIEKALAEYFGVPSYQVKLVSGHASRQKIFDISM